MPDPAGDACSRPVASAHAETAAVATEYVLLLFAIAMVIVLAVIAFGTSVRDRYDQSATCVATVSVDDPVCS